jgi:hypothetical protein
MGKIEERGRNVPDVGDASGPDRVPEGLRTMRRAPEPAKEPPAADYVRGFIDGWLEALIREGRP